MSPKNRLSRLVNRRQTVEITQKLLESLEETFILIFEKTDRKNLFSERSYMAKRDFTENQVLSRSEKSFFS